MNHASYGSPVMVIHFSLVAIPEMDTANDPKNAETEISPPI